MRSMLQDELLRKFNKGTLSYAKLASYKQILMGVTVDGVVNEEEPAFCARFREKQGITDAEHAECISLTGWTAEEWAVGRCRTRTRL